MVITLQPFLIQFTRFFWNTTKKYIRNDLLSERNEDKDTIRRYKNWIAIKKREIESSV